MAIFNSIPPAAALKVAARCQACNSSGEGRLTLPLAARSLTAVEEARADIEAGRSEHHHCPLCGNDRLEVLQIVYEWDEPDLAPLVFDRHAGPLQDGLPVRDEQDLYGKIGRAFSPAAYHRLMLTSRLEPCMYSPSPGLAVCALFGDPAAAHPADYARARLSELLDEDDLSSEHLLVASWGSLARAGGPALWLGPRAADLRDGRLQVVTVTCESTVARELGEVCDAYDLRLVGGQDTPLRIILADPPSLPVPAAGDLGVDVDLDRVVELTVTAPATLREACAIVAGEARSRMVCTLQALARLEGVRGARFGHDLHVTLELEDGRDEQIDFSALARRCGYDPDYLAEATRLLLGDGDQGRGEARSCGCVPAIAVAVRTSEWIREAAEQQGRPPLSRPLRDDLHAVVIEDCPHYVRTLPAGELPIDEAIGQAVKDMHRLRFDVQAREVRGVDGELQAVIACGHNISSVVWNAQLLRGLAAATRLPAGQLGAVLFSTDLVCLVAPGASMDLVALSVAQVQEHHRTLPQNPMQGVFTFTWPGAAAGQFVLSDL